MAIVVFCKKLGSCYINSNENNDINLWNILQYNRGRYIPARWVFRMVNLDHPTKPVFYYVPRRDQNTLLPLVRKHCLAGATIVSDQWRAYLQLRQLGYLHLTVNHSRNFVDPNTG